MTLPLGMVIKTNQLKYAFANVCSHESKRVAYSALSLRLRDHNKLKD